jgi:hypothetical protein
MRKLALAALLVALAASAGAQGWERITDLDRKLWADNNACIKASGPQPALPTGSIIPPQQSETQRTWRKRFDDCMAQRGWRWRQ